MRILVRGAARVLTDGNSASSAQTATYTVLPSVIPQFTSLFRYRVDVNVRDSLTLGVVSADGIGFTSPRPSSRSFSTS